MRPMLLALILCGALAVPLLAQTAPEPGGAPKPDAGAQKKPDQQGDDKKGDKKDDKGDKKTEGKEVKIIAQGAWMMPPVLDPSAAKEKTMVVRNAKDFLKMPPFDKLSDKASPDFLDKYLGNFLKQSLKMDVDFDKQMLIIISLNQPPMPGNNISISKAEVTDGKLMVYYTTKGTVPAGVPAIPSLGTVALIEKFEGKVEFTKVDKNDGKPQPPIGPDGKPLPFPVPIGPDGKPLPVPIGPDGKPLPLPIGPDGKPLPFPQPPIGPDGKPLPLPKPPVGPDGKPLFQPPVGPDGKPLPIPPGGIGPDGKPLPPPKIEPAPKVPGTPGQPTAGTPLPGLPGVNVPAPTDTIPPALPPAPKPAAPPQPAPAPGGG